MLGKQGTYPAGSCAVSKVIEVGLSENCQTGRVILRPGIKVPMPQSGEIEKNYGCFNCTVFSRFGK